MRHWKFKSTRPLHVPRDVYLCDRDFRDPMCSIHTQAELTSTPNTLQTNFRSVANNRCRACTVLSIQPGESTGLAEISYRSHGNRSDQ